MKVVLISTLIAVLSIALASCEHGSKRTPSSSVEKEVSQFLKRLEIQARAQLEGEIRSVEVQARIYNERFLALKKRVDQRLSLLGKDGKQIRDQLNTETQKMVDAVNQEISKSVLEPKVLSLISSLRQYIGPIKSDFDDLIAAIKANPKNKKCWDENKCKIRSFINNILKETQNIIMGELNKLNKQVNDVVNSISDTVSKLENQLQIECSNKVSCYVDYFNKNLPTLLGELKQFQNEVITDINAALANIQSKSVASLKEAIPVYDAIKLKIKQCIKANVK